MSNVINSNPSSTGTRFGFVCCGELYFTLPDAAAVLFHPDLVQEGFPSYTRIESQSKSAYGATVKDVRPRNNKNCIEEIVFSLRLTMRLCIG